MTLQWERGKNPIDKLLVWVEDRYIQMAHALLMTSELDRLAQLEPSRFGAIARRIRPLLTAQFYERAQQLVNARVELYNLGVTRLEGVSREMASRREALQAEVVTLREALTLADRVAQERAVTLAKLEAELGTVRETLAKAEREAERRAATVAASQDDVEEL
jgi:sugar phosphate isomerase/epimerase